MVLEAEHGVKGYSKDFWVLECGHLGPLDVDGEVLLDLVGEGGEDGCR